jgi:hypothetical protein
MFSVWVGSVITTYQLAGIFWTVFGIITVIGIVPIALIACIFQGSWEALFQLVVALALTFGLRILGAMLFSAAESQQTGPKPTVDNLEPSQSVPPLTHAPGPDPFSPEANDKYDAYLAYCGLTGKQLSQSEYITNETWVSELPIDVMAAYSRMHSADDTGKAIEHFKNVCASHGFDWAETCAKLDIHPRGQPF